jgi:hypothetical protein
VLLSFVAFLYPLPKGLRPPVLLQRLRLLQEKKVSRLLSIRPA